MHASAGAAWVHNPLQAMASTLARQVPHQDLLRDDPNSSLRSSVALYIQGPWRISRG